MQMKEALANSVFNNSFTAIDKTAKAWLRQSK